MTRLETPAECRRMHRLEFLADRVRREIYRRLMEYRMDIVDDDEPLFLPGVVGVVKRTIWKLERDGYIVPREFDLTYSDISVDGTVVTITIPLYPA